jgi:GTP-binding protein
VDNLVEYYYAPIIKGKSGEHGQGKNCYGKAAPDQIFLVPVGTLIYRVPEQEVVPVFDPNSQVTFIDFSKLPEDVEGTASPVSEPFEPDSLELIADLSTPHDEFVLCKGGEGGKGNVHFKSARNRVPTQFTDGEEGESGTFYLELRSIADIGLVGYPNAGKSTLLTRISNAHPKIAPYPFTTLTPHIGVVDLPDYRRFTVADIPGLIEGAHENVGLGHDFLRHIVRCKLLAFVLDMAGSEGREPVDDLMKLRRELDLYDPTLSERPWLVVANKMDLPEAAEKLAPFQSRFPKLEVVPMAEGDVAAADRLKRRFADLVDTYRRPDPLPLDQAQFVPVADSGPRTES